MLEYGFRCPTCNAHMGGIGLPPWSWWHKLFGFRCPNCARIVWLADIAGQRPSVPQSREDYDDWVARGMPRDSSGAWV